jgi:hypothetical protein
MIIGDEGKMYLISTSPTSPPFCPFFKPPCSDISSMNILSLVLQVVNNKIIFTPEGSEKHPRTRDVDRKYIV